MDHRQPPMGLTFSRSYSFWTSRLYRSRSLPYCFCSCCILPESRLVWIMLFLLFRVTGNKMSLMTMANRISARP